MANSKKQTVKQPINDPKLLPVRVIPQPGKSPGRKPAITPTVLLLLREAFLLGCDDLEATSYAGIAPATLYNHQKGNQPFLEWKEALKRQPFLKARRAIVTALEYDAEFALKYMERKKKSEFAPSAKLILEDTADKLDPETKAAIDKSLAQHMNKLRERNDGTDNGQVARAISDAN